MFRLIFHFLINVLIILGLSFVLPPFKVENYQAAIFFIIALTIVNSLILPIIKFFTFPISIITLGLFNLLLNLVAIIAVANFVSGIRIEGGPLQTFLIAGAISIALSIAHSLTSATQEE